MIFMDFGHANDTGIGQGHWCVPILSQQPVQRGDVFFQSKRHRERAILEKAKQRVLGPWETREQIGCFSENRLADEQRGVKFFGAFSGPEVMSFRPIEEGDERPSVNDRSHRARSP